MVNVALWKHINEILDFSFHFLFSCFFIVLCSKNIVFYVVIPYQPFGVKNNLDFIIKVNLLHKLSKVRIIFHEIISFSKYLVEYTTRTTVVQRGNSLHCMSKNSLPLPNCLRRPKHVLSATSTQFFRYLWFMPSLGVRSPWYVN